MAVGSVLCRTLYVAIEARWAPWLAPGHGLEGQVVPARGVLEVVRSGVAGLLPGDLVSGACGWQEYTLLEPPQVEHLEPASPMTRTLSVFGPSGALAEQVVGRLPVDVPVVVGPACGGIGNLVCQLAAQRPLGGPLAALVFGAGQRQWATRMGLGATIVDVQADTFAQELGGWLGGHRNCVVVDAGIPNPGPIRAQLPGGHGWLSCTTVTSSLPKVSRELRQRVAAGRVAVFDQVTTGLESAPTVLAEVAAGANIGERIVKVAT